MGDTLRAQGEFDVRQTDFGIKPVSVAGGTLKIKDELKCSFDLLAAKGDLSVMCLAIPGQIVELVPDTATGAIVDVVGVRRRIDLGLLQDDPPVPGDWVLIHVGFAMSKISEADAREQMETLSMLGESDGGRRRGERATASATTTTGGGTNEVRRRIPRRRADRAGARRDPPPRRSGAPLPHHGSVRRAHARDLPVRPEGRAAARTSS